MKRVASFSLLSEIVSFAICIVWSKSICTYNIITSNPFCIMFAVSVFLRLRETFRKTRISTDDTFGSQKLEFPLVSSSLRTVETSDSIAPNYPNFETAMRDTRSYLLISNNQMIYSQRSYRYFFKSSTLLLQSLYESIKTEPFKIPEDDGNDLMHTFFNPDKEGWLWKQGNSFVDCATCNSTFDPSDVSLLPFTRYELKRENVFCVAERRTKKERCSSHCWSNNVANVSRLACDPLSSGECYECMRMLTLYSGGFFF